MSASPAQAGFGAAPARRCQAGAWRSFPREAASASGAEALAQLDLRLQRFADDAAGVDGGCPGEDPSRGRCGRACSSPGVPPADRRARASPGGAAEGFPAGSREVLADMLGDVARNIVEAVSQEVGQAVRQLRREMSGALAQARDRGQAQAAAAVVDELKQAQVPTVQAIGDCLATVVKEIDQVRFGVDFQPVFDALQAAEARIAAGVENGRKDVDFSELSMAIREAKTEVDYARIGDMLKPIDRLVRAAQVDLSPVLAALQQPREAPDLTELSGAVRELRSEVQVSSAVQARRLDADFADVVQELRACRAELHSPPAGAAEVDQGTVLQAVAALRTRVDQIAGEQAAWRVRAESDARALAETVDAGRREVLEAVGVLSDTGPLLEAITEAIVDNKPVADFTEVVEGISRSEAEVTTALRGIAGSLTDMHAKWGQSRRADVDFKEVLQAIAASRAEVVTPLLAAIQRVPLDIDFSELSDAIRESRPQVDFGPVFEAIRANRPQVDLTPVLEAVHAGSPGVDLTPVLEAIGEASERAMAKDTSVDLSPVSAALRAGFERLDGRLEAVQRRAEQPPDVDFSKVLKAVRESRVDVDLAPVLRAVAQGSEAVRAALREHAARTDLAPVLGAIAGVSDKVRKEAMLLSKTIAALRPCVDLSPVVEALAALRVEVDFEPVLAAIEASRDQVDVSAALADMAEARGSVDFAPVLQAISAVAAMIDFRPVLESISASRCDLAPVLSAIKSSRREVDVSGVLKVMRDTPPVVDFTPILQALQNIGEAQKDILAGLAAGGAFGPRASAAGQN